MAKVLYKGPEGTVVVPSGLFLDRSDGGHLVLNPPRDVWECSELTAEISRLRSAAQAAGRRLGAQLIESELAPSTTLLALKRWIMRLGMRRPRRAPERHHGHHTNVVPLRRRK